VSRPTRVVVVGGSVAGLSASLFLARRGHHVTVLEQDPSPRPADIASAGAWRRRATPQAAHSHAFLARTREILAVEAPDVLSDLADAGVRESRLGGADGFDDVVVVNARRSVFEWVLRRAVERQDGVALRLGAVAGGLSFRINGMRRVAGVGADDGVVPADVVVDAAGKRSAVRELSGAGAATRDVPCGISYLTRFYRLRDSEPTALNRGYTHGASFDRYSCLVFPADNGAFSITFGVLPEDRDIRLLRSPDAFDAAVRSIPAIAPWVDPDVAEPTTDVAAMSSLRNLLRPPGPAEPAGLHAVGDASCVTNPAHTRGTTLAVVAAQRLADVIDEHPTDLSAQRDALSAFALDELATWVEDSVAQDADRLARWRPDEAPVQPLRRHRLTNGQAHLVAQRDPAVANRFAQLQSTLVRPTSVLDDDHVAAAYETLQASGWTAPRCEGPSHDELVEIARHAGASCC
jgi:flavin-dependent dehydrogenase